MLNVVFGYGNSYTDAIVDALRTYNEIEGQKTFHTKDVHVASTEIIDAPRCMCEIWFTLRVIVQQPETYEYVGSKGIDPSDPNWREQWEQQQQSQNE